MNSKPLTEGIIADLRGQVEDLTAKVREKNRELARLKVLPEHGDDTASYLAELQRERDDLARLVR